MLAYVVRPLEPWLHPTVIRKPSPFSASWSSTMDLLDRELWALGVRTAWVLQLDHTERDIRRDGGVRANAAPRSPRVQVCADTRHGPMKWPCDRFQGWHDNVRAIALSLEALRRVDRYGVTGHGEQYRAWTALPQREHQLTRDQAAQLIAEWADPAAVSVDAVVAALLAGDRTVLAAAYRKAARTAHPDAGGDQDSMARLNAARDLLAGGDGA